MIYRSHIHVKICTVKDLLIHSNVDTLQNRNKNIASAK